MIKSTTKRISATLEEDIRKFRERIRNVNGFNISFVEASKKYAEINKDTVLRLTRKLKTY